MRLTRLTKDEWTIGALRQHLQYAVDLELWTIPFYLSAQLSIVDRRSDAYQLIQTIVHQEMLHLQLVSNVANAYGLSPSFDAPRYEGQTIPHLDFALDTPNPTADFSPYSAEIGPLDTERLNAMCLIEYPEWGVPPPSNFSDERTEYGSIGELYEALVFGAAQMKSHLRGGVKQVDYFSAYYRGYPSMTVTAHGEEGFRQARLLLDTIREQGEGATKKRERIPRPMQNTADDMQPSMPHFDKFYALRQAPVKPATYPVKPVSEYSPADLELLEILTRNFAGLRVALQHLFAGDNPESFVERMVSVGASLQNCWKHGVTPRFNSL